VWQHRLKHSEKSRHCNVFLVSLLGTYAEQLQKVTGGPVICVCPSVCTLQHDSNETDLHEILYLRFLVKFVSSFWCCWKVDKSDRHFMLKPMYVYVIGVYNRTGCSLCGTNWGSSNGWWYFVYEIFSKICQFILMLLKIGWKWQTFYVETYVRVCYWCL